MSAAWDDLSGHMIGDEDDLQEPQLGDVEHVERLLRGVAWRQRKITQARSLVEAEKARLDEWLEQEEKRFDPSFHLRVLEGYHRARLADDPKAKSISLPSGTLQARQQPARWDIDPDVFVPWAESHAPDLVRVKRVVDPDRAEIKKRLGVDGHSAVTGAGEVVPGVVVEPGDVKFSVKVDGE